jgi:NAD(P)-dependent dehydrogenase (short-subunit alcohol dehydrogenase family)
MLYMVATSFIAPAAAEPTVLITGSNRGIGLEIARVYATRGWNVIATCRTPDKADDLKAIAAEYENLIIEELDVTDDREIAVLATKFDGQPIDILINNAAISGDRTKQSFGSFDFGIYEQVMRVNVHAPLKMAEAFMGNVGASEQKKFINISSTQGSISATRGDRGLSYFYKSSKSALHMVMHTLSIEMKGRGITVGLVSPGWVDTNFGGMPSLPGMITAAESGAAVVSVIDDYGLEKSGTLMSHKGEIEAW